MSDAPADPQDSAPVPAKRAGGRRLGPLPVWLWILLIAIVAIALIVLGLALLARDGAPSPTGSPSPSDSSAPPSPTATTTPSETPSATATSDAEPGAFDSALPDFLSDTLNSQNTAVLAEGGTFSNPVFVLAANSDLSQNMTPEDAVGAMDFMFTPSDPNPWDLALSDSVLAGYRAGPYGQYFPVGAIVARSHDGHVFSFIGHDSTITTMFMAASDELLH
jgi:hypothetical protein